jgi:hypothetical protein
MGFVCIRMCNDGIVIRRGSNMLCADSGNKMYGLYEEIRLSESSYKQGT